MPSLSSRPTRRPAWWTRQMDYCPRVGEIVVKNIPRAVETDYPMPLATPFERALETEESRDLI